MRLGYFAMPMHPLGRAWADTLREDQEAVVLADSLGFHDAFIGEHLTDQYENITNSLLFLATLISQTKQIRLGTGTTNLSHQHPVLVAVNSAMFDHMSGGRFILGVSPGALPSDAEVLGILAEDRNQMFGEAVEVITRLWQEEPPYDIDLPGNRFKVTTAPRSTRRPASDRAEAAAVAASGDRRTVVAPFSKGVVAMGAKDFHPLSANFLLPQWVATHWPNYVQGKESAGPRRRRGLAVARTVFVADDDATAQRYGRDDPDSPYRFYYTKMLAKMTKLGRLGLFKTHKDQPDEEITLDYVLDKLVLTGTALPSPSRCSRCGRRPATSASSCTPASTGSTRHSGAGRWN